LLRYTRTRMFFEDLRAAVYSTDDERKRFRQLVVKSVMATDIMDKELQTLRNKRWETAFRFDKMNGMGRRDGREGSDC
jgi:hypothetical protein